MINNKTANNIIVWVLADDRPGNSSQAIGLAEKLMEKILEKSNKSELHIKKINYNSLARLPNFLKINGLMGIDCASKKSLLSSLSKQNLKPHIIISAGRKTAPINLFLKKYYQAFAVQIMNPNLSKVQFAKFDLVVLPKHDKEIEQKNVVRTIGALHRVNQKLLDGEYQKFSEQFSNIASPKIVLLVGGDSKKGKFSYKTIENLGEVVSRITNNMKGNLLVLNSRRTGVEKTEILDKNLNCHHPQTKTFFKWSSGENWRNPYFAVLKTADFIIATGDSISMCSEICSLGKPVYIFNPKEICSKKHLAFHQNLFDQGCAKKLELSLNRLESYSPKTLAETDRIADLVLGKIG